VTIRDILNGFVAFIAAMAVLGFVCFDLQLAQTERLGDRRPGDGRSG
jgi:hypothetical protein